MRCYGRLGERWCEPGKATGGRAQPDVHVNVGGGCQGHAKDQEEARGGRECRATHSHIGSFFGFAKERLKGSGRVQEHSQLPRALQRSLHGPAPRQPSASPRAHARETGRCFRRLPNNGACGVQAQLEHACSMHACAIRAVSLASWLSPRVVGAPRLRLDWASTRRACTCSRQIARHDVPRLACARDCDSTHAATASALLLKRASTETSLTTHVHNHHAHAERNQPRAGQAPRPQRWGTMAPCSACWT